MRIYDKQQKENGQALVLLVFGIAVLLGFTALAIDGGMLYADRRNAQNGADAASLAGGGAGALYLENNNVNWLNWSCSNSAVLNAMATARASAIGRAGDNSYTIDSNVSDKNGVTTRCENGINRISYIDKYIDIETFITADTRTSFAQVIFGGPLRNTVNAITRIRPRAPLAFGHAIVGTNNQPCSGNSNGVSLGGNNTIRVNGGGIYSNGCMDGDGNAFNVEVTNGTVVYAGEGGNNLENVSPSPVHAPYSIPDDAFEVPPPDCTGLTARTQHSGDTILYPGVYTNIKLTHGPLELKPGLYCFTGSPSAINVTGGDMTANNVTLYALNGEIKITGGEHHLSAYPVGTKDADPAIPGILIYLARGNTHSVTMEGNEATFYLGTVYAPDGNIEVLGTGDIGSTFFTQLIGSNVKVSGDALIDINFNGGQNYQRPASLELFR